MRFSKSRVLVLLLVLLAFALRLYQLDFFSLRGDESFTVLFVQKPLAQMWQETLTIEPNPPLLYFLLRGWIVVAGASEFATRFFSLFFGVLCIPLTYTLARALLPLLTKERSQTQTRTMSRQSASAFVNGVRSPIPLIAAFLIAINPYQIWHSQDVRNYTMWPALSLLALVFFWQWYRATTEPRRGAPLWSPSNSRSPNSWSPHLLFFTLAELAALYTHYYEAFILLALNLFVFATLWRNRRKIVEWLGVQIVLAILYLPYPLILSNRVSAYGEGSGRQGVALWDIARETFSTFVLSETLDATLRAWLWIPFALVALTGLIFLFSRDKNRALFFILYAGIPTLSVFALNTIRPLYLERYLNGIAPAYYLLLAVGIVALSNTIAQFISRQPKLQSPVSPSLHLSISQSLPAPRSTLHAPRYPVPGLALLAAIAFVSFLALSNYWTNPAYAKSPDWRGLANIINTNAQRGDIIVQNFPETSLLYYDKTNLPLVVYPETYLPDAKTTQQLNGMSGGYQRVWFIPAAPDVWDPDQFVEGWLDAREDLLQEWDVGEFRLRSYATPASYLNTMKPVNATFGDTFKLLGFRSAHMGDSVQIVLYWRALQNPATGYTIGVQLADIQGHILAQDANIPVNGNLPTNQWRKNQTVVDQHTLALPPSVEVFRVNICDSVSKACLTMTDPVTAIGRDYFRLP